MRVLTDHEREILRLRFGEDLHQTEIAERVGISPTQVARVLRGRSKPCTKRPRNRVAATGGPAG